ncbi:MAG: hypothetical protein AAGM22_28740 [Acidobacteriota bacterium]
MGTKPSSKSISGDQNADPTDERMGSSVLEGHDRLLELFGSIDWDPGYDYKSERSRDAFRSDAELKPGESSGR